MICVPHPDPGCKLLRSTCQCPASLSVRSKISKKKSDNFSREIKVGQISVNKSDNFSREIEIGQINVLNKIK